MGRWGGYPHFHLEDKVVLVGGGVVMDQPDPDILDQTDPPILFTYSRKRRGTTTVEGTEQQAEQQQNTPNEAEYR